MIWSAKNGVLNPDSHYGKKREIGIFKICSYLFFYVKLLLSFIFPIASSRKTVSAKIVIVVFSEKL
jgi:hypothetical protein